jgi:hypothetical protein
VPRAHSIRLGRCSDPECTAVHVILLTEDDEPIASCALSPHQIEQLRAWADYPPVPRPPPGSP